MISPGRRLFNRFLSFSVGFLIVYGFANPDLERVWEPKPLFDQRDHAFLSFFEVDSKDYELFEKRIKGLTRYLQRRSGYHQTKLLRLEDTKKQPLKEPKFQYIGIQTWFSPNMMKNAVEQTFSQKVISQLKMNKPYNAVLYKILVDDSSYTP